MRKFLAPAILSACLMAACVPASLGPDSPTTGETTATATTSTLPQRMRAGVNELWAWYNALKGRVDPAIAPMRKLYVAAQDMIVAVSAEDWIKALGVGATAWRLVDEVKAVAGK